MKPIQWRKEAAGTYSLDMEQLRPLLEFKARIDWFQNIDLSKHTITWLSAALKTICNHQTLRFTYLHHLGSVFRGRVLTEAEAKVMTASDLWYPPKHRITGLGRVNRRGQQIFYCASSALAVLFELDPSPGSLLAILRSDVEPKDSPLNCVQLGIDRELLNKVEVPQQIIDTIGKWQGDHDTTLIVNGIPICDISESLILQAFFHKLFAQRVPDDNRDLYKYTIAVADFWFANKDLAGIAYPTICHRFQQASTMVGHNAAIRTSAADAYLKPAFVGLYRCSEVKEKGYSMELVSSSAEIDREGKIRWSSKMVDMFGNRNSGAV